MPSMTSARTSLTGKEMLISFTVIGNAGVAALNQMPEGRKSAVVCKCQQPWLRPLSRHCRQDLLVFRDGEGPKLARPLDHIGFGGATFPTSTPSAKAFMTPIRPPASRYKTAYQKDPATEQRVWWDTAIAVQLVWYTARAT